MQVFVPGKPYVVITGTDGRFILNNLPVGDYSLNFMLRGKILYFNKWAEVSANKTTSLDLISICDAENATTNTTLEQSTADTPATPKPVAPIQANPLILNDIDCSVIKEGVLFLLNNGKGKCADGKVVVKECNTGYADCDKNTSNGCEIDTNNDAEHCGGCFNECSQLDSCNIGMC